MFVQFNASYLNKLFFILFFMIIFVYRVIDNLLTFNFMVMFIM